MRCLVLLCALGGCYREQQPVPVFGVPDIDDLPHGDISFDCEAAAGYRSGWSQAVGSSGQAHGSVFIAAVRHHPRWAADASVAVRGRDKRAWATVTFTVDTHSGTLQPLVRYLDKASSKVLTQPLRPRPISGASFELEWEPTRLRLRLESTALWLDVPLAFTPERFELGCSTGDAVFYGVKLEPGAVSPPAE